MHDLFLVPMDVGQHMSRLCPLSLGRHGRHLMLQLTEPAPSCPAAAGAGAAGPAQLCGRLCWRQGVMPGGLQVSARTPPRWPPPAAVHCVVWSVIMETAPQQRAPPEAISHHKVPDAPPVTETLQAAGHESAWTCRPAEGSAAHVGMGTVQHAHLLIVLQRGWVVCMEALRPCHVRLRGSHVSLLKAAPSSRCDASSAGIHSSAPAASNVCSHLHVSCHRVWPGVVSLEQAILHAGQPDMDQPAGPLPQQACAAGATGSWHEFARLQQSSLRADQHQETASMPAATWQQGRPPSYAEC